MPRKSREELEAELRALDAEEGEDPEDGILFGCIALPALAFFIICALGVWKLVELIF